MKNAGVTGPNTAELNSLAVTQFENDEFLNTNQNGTRAWNFTIVESIPSKTLNGLKKWTLAYLLFDCNSQRFCMIKKQVQKDDCFQQNYC